MSGDRNIKAEVWLEGQRIPFNSIRVTVNLNQPASAEIVLPPVPGLQDIPPRTWVHVFYEDRQTTSSDTAEMKLLFEGEVMGYGFNKSPAGRGFTLQCEDLSNYFSYVYMYLFTDMQGLGHASGTTGDQASLLNFRGVEPGTEEEGDKRTFNFGLTDKDNVVSSLLAEPQVPNIFTNIIRHAIESDYSYVTAGERTKLLDKIAALPDEQVVELFNNRDSAKLIMGNLLGSMPADAELNRILQQIMATYYYYGVPNPVASYASAAESKVASYIFKPLTFFTPPPMCNVIFPSQYAQFSYSRYFMAEPTRLHLSTFIINNFPGKSYVAPKELIDSWNAYTGENNDTINEVEAQKMDTLRKTILNKDVIPDITNASREDVKGIIPRLQPFQESEVLRGFLLEQDEDSQDKYFSAVAEYELLKAQHGPRSATVVGYFNPQWVCGFPALVLDNENFVFGEALSISHYISAGGENGSTMTMAYCRHKDLLGVEGEKAELPLWISNKFKESSVGIEAYPELLGDGMKSIMDPITDPDNPSVLKAYENQEESAAALSKLYKKQSAHDQDGFVRTTTLRRIVTKEETFDAISATKVNNDEYSNRSAEAQELVSTSDPFRDTVLNVVRPLTELLRTKKDYNID